METADAKIAASTWWLACTEDSNPELLAARRHARNSPPMSLLPILYSGPLGLLLHEFLCKRPERSRGTMLPQKSWKINMYCWSASHNSGTLPRLPIATLLVLCDASSLPRLTIVIPKESCCGINF